MNVFIIFLITSDFGVPRVKNHPHPRVDAKMVHQQPRSTTLVELCPCFAEQGIDGKIQIEFFDL